MKKRYLSALMIVCFISVFPGILNCQCVIGDCHVASRAIQTKAPHCHPEAAQTKREDTSRKECCGKCRIEKAAVFSNELLPASDIHHRNALAGIKSFSDFHSKLQPPSFFRGESPRPPPGFFVRHILNTTFSFRAPPQGRCF